jgi:bifunctional non-homologous end joining protein LigD
VAETKAPSTQKDYRAKRSFDKTPEPAPEVAGDVDPGTAPPGDTFVIHQHHARRLHFDLRLEMMNGRTPVLVSWAVPKNLPVVEKEKHLAVHVEDHPFEYGSFSGTIPAGEYGGGEVRIFDEGRYETLEQEPGKLTFRLHGKRMRGVWHLIQTKRNEGRDWLVWLRVDERPPADPLPPLVPQMATLAREAFDDDDWYFEPKWDGVRALAACGIDETMLVSRNRRDITATYPELADIHKQLVAVDAVVDGEIVAMLGGRPSFERLQSRMNLQNPHDIKRAVKSTPVTYVAFDLLYLDGRSLTDEPLEERKELLDELVVPTDRIQVSPVSEGEGTTLAEATKAAHLEGIVAKRKGSVYHPGKRVREWLKIKVTHDVDVVVGGWSKGEGNRADSFGALLVGAYDDDGELRFMGSVGTGFNQETIGQVLELLRDCETDEVPFKGGRSALRSAGKAARVKDPRWVEPALVARVEFRELTGAGKLRAPSFKGLRADRKPEEVTFAEIEAVAQALS